MAAGFSAGCRCYEGNLDDVVGIAFAKDLIRAERDGHGDRTRCGDFARRPTSSPRPSGCRGSCARCRSASSTWPSSSTSTAARPGSSPSRTSSRSWWARSSTSTTSRSRPSSSLADGEVSVTGAPAGRRGQRAARRRAARGRLGHRRRPALQPARPRPRGGRVRRVDGLRLVAEPGAAADPASSRVPASCRTQHPSPAGDRPGRSRAAARCARGSSPSWAGPTSASPPSSTGSSAPRSRSPRPAPTPPAGRCAASCTAPAPRPSSSTPRACTGPAPRSATRLNEQVADALDDIDVVRRRPRRHRAPSGPATGGARPCRRATCRGTRRAAGGRGPLSTPPRRREQGRPACHQGARSLARRRPRRSSARRGDVRRGRGADAGGRVLPGLGGHRRRGRRPRRRGAGPAARGPALLPRRHGDRRARGVLGGRARARAAAGTVPRRAAPLHRLPGHRVGVAPHPLRDPGRARVAEGDRHRQGRGGAERGRHRGARPAAARRLPRAACPGREALAAAPRRRSSASATDPEPVSAAGLVPRR